MRNERAGSLRPRLIGIAVGLGYAVAAGITASHAYDDPEFLRSYFWPLAVAGAALLGVPAVLSFLGALVHPAGLLVASVASFVYFIGSYDSESVWGPLLALAIAALVYAFVIAGGGVRVIGRMRLAILGVAIVIATAGVIAMQAPKQTINWERMRTPSGGIELRIDVFDTTCGPAVAKDIDEIDSGCQKIVPARRAKYVVGYSAIAVLLATVGLAGAPKKRVTIERALR